VVIFTQEIAQGPDDGLISGAQKPAVNIGDRAPGVLARTIPAAGASDEQRQEETRGKRVANIKSQIKRVKTNEKRRQRNKSVRSAVRTAVRRFREAVAAGDTEKATELQRAAARALDKAASKGVIHKNQAANRKSAMAKQAAASSS
jgi:small subunit ribosomal protein S20